NGPQWHGLSPLGKELVAEANRLGIVRDASHASDDVLVQLIELSRTPIVLSHSSCRAIHDHPRNVDDRRLRKLAAAGGVIQINSMYVAATEQNSEYAPEVAKLRARYGPLATLSTQEAAEFTRKRRALDRKYGIGHATFDDFLRLLLHALQEICPEYDGIGAERGRGGYVAGMRDVDGMPEVTEEMLA